MRSLVIRALALFGVPGAALAQPAASPIAPPAGAAVHSPATDSSRGVLIAPGDYVRVTVWRKAELSGEFLVAADSSLKHPLYQDVKVAGLPVAAAQERVRTYLLRYEAAPQISLDPLFQVAVGGDVRTPNLYRLAPETNIAQAVALAGGPDDRGRLDRVSLLRGGRTYLLDLTSADGAAVRMPVQSGDRIFVGRQRDVLRDTIAPLASLGAAIASITVLIIRR
ncbi:hypothetical protein tb265_15810 [Gemmatimonadetes bacterium T265]|nr:hypothetical protein tb265_15810 [Gemmatimonadetes bacterium T265]